MGADDGGLPGWTYSAGRRCSAHIPRSGRVSRRCAAWCSHLCGVVGIMGIHIIVAITQFQYQLVHLVGEPVQRGLEFYQQVAGDNDGEAYCGDGG